MNRLRPLRKQLPLSLALSLPLACAGLTDHGEPTAAPSDRESTLSLSTPEEEPLALGAEAQAPSGRADDMSQAEAAGEDKDGAAAPKTRRRVSRPAASPASPPAKAGQLGKSTGAGGLGFGVMAPNEVRSGDFEGRADLEVSASVITAQDRLSTFAVDVDTAAYSIARRSLLSNTLPTPTLVRVEEFINYFRYDYDPPAENPFSIQVDGAISPADPNTHLLRVGIQSKVVEDEERLPSNLVFLVDTSCSMTSGDKLELAKRSLKTAVDHLSAKDKVAITTYAGGVRVALSPTRGDQKERIKRAIDGLQTGGGTNMESGLTLAYRQAAQMLAPKTNTRIIVCSDGDANIGKTSPEALLREIRGYVSEGVRLSTIGFGDGNYKDVMMEKLANQGNGNYFYIDSDRMADRVFGRDLTKMLQDVAQDVKIQVDFEPEAVKEWRLVGYENRAIADHDFRNDKVDAGEIGAGHQVTALYELQLVEGAEGALATVRVRSKKPRAERATETSREVAVAQVQRPFERAPKDLRFAAAVLGGAEVLRMSPHARHWTLDKVIALATDALNGDPDREEYLELMLRARALLEGANRMIGEGPVTKETVFELARALRERGDLSSSNRILVGLAQAGDNDATLRRLYDFGKSALGGER